MMVEGKEIKGEKKIHSKLAAQSRNVYVADIKHLIPSSGIQVYMPCLCSVPKAMKSLGRYIWPLSP